MAVVGFFPFLLDFSQHVFGKVGSRTLVLESQCRRDETGLPDGS